MTVLSILPARTTTPLIWRAVSAFGLKSPSTWPAIAHRNRCFRCSRSSFLRASGVMCTSSWGGTRCGSMMLLRSRYLSEAGAAGGFELSVAMLIFLKPRCFSLLEGGGGDGGYELVVAVSVCMVAFFEEVLVIDRVVGSTRHLWQVHRRLGLCARGRDSDVNSRFFIPIESSRTSLQ